MNIRFVLAAAFLSAVFGVPGLQTDTHLSTASADWLLAPSTYTHSPTTGERVSQYAQNGPFFVYGTESVRQSGYHHFRSSINAGGSSDNLHVVERWGDDVRPYGEWRYPYRPYSAPYSQWGQPYGGLNITPYGPGYGSAFPQPYPSHGGGRDGGRGGAYGPSYGTGYGTGYGNGYEYSPHDSPRRDRGHRRIAPQPWHEGHYPQYKQEQRGQISSTASRNLSKCFPQISLDDSVANFPLFAIAVEDNFAIDDPFVA